MHQEEINNDLKHYINDKKKSRPFWQRFKSKPKTQEEIDQALGKEPEEKIEPKEKKELEEIENKLEEVNEIEEKVEEEIEEEREGLLKRFFKKLRSKKEHKKDSKEDDELDEEKDDDIEEDDSSEDDKDIDNKKIETQEVLVDEETKAVLKNLHEWLVQLPPEKLQEFKNSEDFRLYTKVLKKYKLIK